MISDILIFNQTRFCRKIKLYSVYWRTACFSQIFQFVFTSSCVYEGSCLIYVICVCLFAYSSVQHILCICFVFLRLVYLMFPVSMDCPFLSFWLSLLYSLTFICLILRIFGCSDRQKKLVFNFTPTFKNDYFIIIFLLVQSFSFRIVLLLFHGIQILPMNVSR